MFKGYGPLERVWVGGCRPQPPTPPANHEGLRPSKSQGEAIKIYAGRAFRVKPNYVSAHGHITHALLQ
eukprot:14176291-Heterocapsa_arctica.AAC.1